MDCFEKEMLLLCTMVKFLLLI